MLGFFSVRPNWNPPPPNTQASVSPPKVLRGGGEILLACGRGVGGVPFGRGADTVVLQVYILITQTVKNQVFTSKALWTKKSVGDPDPHVFGPPGSKSVSQRYGSGFGSKKTEDNVPKGKL